ncbi:MAG TPA: FG-GAP-like repeat-containing protein [bacterium]|nr:FG-GAP-like repeat-containing protein [bacterium]HQP99859.1 FG-GAP-like repeat-containing protein [bacterium]
MVFRSILFHSCAACAIIMVCACAYCAEEDLHGANPFIIELDIPAPETSAGGIVVWDIDDDGRMDYLVTVPGHVAGYANDGTRRWVNRVDVRVGESSERVGLPGHHGPGVTAGDIDGDGQTEVLYLTNDSVLHVVNGKNGIDKWTAQPPRPEGTERWEHLAIANFRGEGDCDLFIQTTNRDGYRVGHHIAAYSLEDLCNHRYTPLWQRADFTTCAHNGARLADLDGDGRDEVLGGQIVSATGEFLCNIPLRGHIDSIFAYDVRPDVPGLEVVALEEGGRDGDQPGNRVYLYTRDRVLWETNYQEWEPQNAVVGEFDPDTPGLEIWCRSRFNEHQRPFIFDANGRLIAHYELDHVAPSDWTKAGVEVIHTIDWTGETKQLAAGKERHTEGDVAIFDPMTGKFIARFKEKAARLYVADVAGDWREELVVLNGNTLRIYRNEAANPNPDRPRLWKQQHYSRSKRTHNYYSP